MPDSHSGDRRRFILMSLSASTAIATSAGATEIKREGGTTSASAKSTYLVLYRPGEAWKSGTPIGELPLREHGRYMLDLYQRGAMRFAGPFADDSGAAVMIEAEDDEAARALVEADPAVASKIFHFEVHRWSLVPWAEIEKRHVTPTE